MTDQLRISDSGQIEEQPLTWDQEPMWSVDTVQEGLFERSAFEQMPGQIALEPLDGETTEDTARWARILAKAATQPASTPGNNVWD